MAKVQKKTSNTPKPKVDAPEPIQGPPGKGQYTMRYMDKGQWRESLSGKKDANGAGAGWGGMTYTESGSASAAMRELMGGRGGGLRNQGK